MFTLALLSAFTTVGGSLAGFLALVGFIIAARAYGKAKSVEALSATNEILGGEVEALKLSRDRMIEDLDSARSERVALTNELAKVSARTDLEAHQKHLDTQHAEDVALLKEIAVGTTRIADESAERNGHIAEMLKIVLIDVAEIRRDVKILPETS